MTAIEAMIYCLGFVSEEAEDGEYQSAIVYDKNGLPHWFAWRQAHSDEAIPFARSEAVRPFTAKLEPYRMGKEPHESD